MNIDDIYELIATKETERIEFKEWKDKPSFDGGEKYEGRRCLLGYCVAIGNAGGGHLLAGVTNAGKLVGVNWESSDDYAKKIFTKTRQKVTAEEVIVEGKRVVVFSIPPRPAGQVLKYAGIALMRVNDSLEVMTDEQYRTLVNEVQPDKTYDFVKGVVFSDLDPDAVAELRSLYKSKNSEAKNIDTLPDQRLLEDLELIEGERVRLAALVLIGKKEALNKYLRNSEISFEYRNAVTDIQHVERIDFREAFVFLAAEIWSKVSSRQQMHQIQEGLFRTDIPAYNIEVFREALFNAICHRDYSMQGQVFIKQSPQQLEFTSPGGFPYGVTKDNIIDVPSTPRNRFLTEIFQKVFRGVERSGQGADKIFRITIEEGKGAPDYSDSDDMTVVLKIPASLQDSEFIRFLSAFIKQKNIALSAKDYVLLEKIRKGEKISRVKIQHLIDYGLLESYGKTNSMRFILSSDYYNHAGELGLRTKRIGLSRDKNKEIILSHLQKHGKGTMAEFVQIFPELKKSDVTNLLMELRRAEKIKNSGSKGRAAFWELT